MTTIEETVNHVRVILDKLYEDKRSKWTDAHDRLLTTWRKQASISLWLQLASNYYYARLNDYLSYPVMVFSTATSIGVFGLNDSLTGKFTISIISLISGMITAVNKHCRAPEKSQEYALRAKDYYTFIRELDFLLATDKEERSDLGETIERIKNTYNRIVDMQLEPPIHILREYEKKFRPLEASMFSDLMSEFKSQPQPEDDNIDNISNQSKPPPSPFVKMMTQAFTKQEQKAAHKKLAKTIFSPYQLFVGGDLPTSNLVPALSSQKSVRRDLDNIFKPSLKKIHIGSNGDIEIPEISFSDNNV